MSATPVYGEVDIDHDVAPVALFFVDIETSEADIEIHPLYTPHELREVYPVRHFAVEVV